MKIERLSSDPEILLLRDFLSREEVAHFLRAGEGSFIQSRVSCDKSGGCVSNMRTSATAYLGQDSITQAVAARGMRFAGLPYAEDLQIVRYFAGQEFRPHLDAFDPKTFDGRQELGTYGGRQRDATLLIYLNRPEGGGATRFTELGLDVEPIPGAALFWRNVGADGRIDPRTRHAGMPVTSGVKYAVNLWIRGAKAIAGIPLERRMGSLRNFSAQRLGRIGEFRPSTESDSKQLNVKVDRRPYTGTKYTLEKMAAYIKDGSVSPSMRQFAEMVVRNAGVAPREKLSNRRAAEILLGYVKSNVRYRPDPENVEMVQEPHITLCVPGASICIPVEDCDGLTVALGSLMGAYGIPVMIMKQTFSDGSDEEHVLIIFKNDDGRWLPADPSAPSGMGVGFRAPVGSSGKEVVIDPLDPGKTGTQAAEFVGIGRIMIGTVRDDVVATQTRLEDLALATALAVEACPAGRLDDAAWTNLSQRILAYVSADPDTVKVIDGEALAQELYSWGDKLQNAGCQRPIPAPMPVPAPPPVPAQSPGSEWASVAKWGLGAVIAVAGVYGLKQAVDLVRIEKHLAPAAFEARRLVRKRRRAA